jgi:hypothetical protein
MIIMKKIYLAMLSALFMGSTRMAGDVVTLEELEDNTDGCQHVF